MSTTEVIDAQEKKRIRRVNLIANLSEIVIIVLYLVIGFGGIKNAIMNGNFVGIFESVKTAILFFSIALLVMAVLFLVVKPLRTKSTTSWAIFNIVFAILNLIELYA
ncbi:MAG: hypothetical protein IK008_02785 [Bacteroidales bacterium]|nr:hypothetical protein [Bacteroidales bacterium]